LTLGAAAHYARASTTLRNRRDMTRITREKSLPMKVSVAGNACIAGIFVQRAFDACRSIDIIAPR
jgi:hypothetical protein